MKTWIAIFVASLLMVGSMGSEGDAEVVVFMNRRLLNNEVNRNVPGGPNVCYHCFGETTGRTSVPPRATDKVNLRP